MVTPPRAELPPMAPAYGEIHSAPYQRQTLRICWLHMCFNRVDPNGIGLCDKHLALLREQG